MNSFFNHIPLALLLLLLLLLPQNRGMCREEVWEEELQYEARVKVNMLIKALDAPYDLRANYVRELVQIASGKLRPLALQQLALAMQQDNSQITEGIIEVLCRVNDESKIPQLENELLFNPAPDVRLTIIVHLPVFCVQSPQIRTELLDLIEGYERHLPERLLEALRLPPLDPKTGEYDIQKDEDVRGRIETALAWQLNPVEAVIEFGLEKRQQTRALAMLKYLMGIDLGYNRKSWVEYWRSRGKTYVSPVQNEILETQINSCRMLAFMGAEGTPLLCDQTRWVMATPFNPARQAALEMISIITRFARNKLPALQSRLQTPGLNQSEEVWLKRQQAAFERLVALVLELAEKYTGDENDSIRIALLDCLGATGAQEASKYVGQALRIDGKSHGLRMHAIKVLGQLANLQSVLLLEDMAVYRAIAVNRELQIMEYQRIRAAFGALGDIVGAVKDGRLNYADRAASLAAFKYLLKALVDERKIEGAPPQAESQQQSVAFFARNTLRTVFDINENSYQPQVWQALYDRYTAAPAVTPVVAPK